MPDCNFGFVSGLEKNLLKFILYYLQNAVLSLHFIVILPGQRQCNNPTWSVDLNHNNYTYEQNVHIWLSIRSQYYCNSVLLIFPFHILLIL